MLNMISQSCKLKKISSIWFIFVGVMIFLFWFCADTSFANDITREDLMLNADAIEKAKNPAQWDLTKDGVFNSIFLFFRAKCIEAQTLLIPIGMYLTAVLAVIQLCTTWTLFEGQLRVFELIKEAIRCSVVFAVIANASVLTEGLIRGFEFIGAVASGLFTASQAMDANLWQQNSFSPSAIVTMGSAAMSNLFSSAGDFVTKFICFFLGLAGYVATAFIALQVTLTSVEYYLFTGLGVALLPFSVLRYTQFLSSRIIQGAASFGVKMMVVYFMVGLVMSLLKATKDQSIAAGVNGMQMGVILNFVLVYVVMGYLVWKLPSLVQGMISGSPQMEGNGMVAGAAAFAASAAGKTISTAGRVHQTWKDTKEDNGGSGSDATKKASEMSADSGGNADSGQNAQKEIKDKSGNGLMLNMAQMGSAAKQAMANGGSIGATASGTAGVGAAGGSSSVAGGAAGASGGGSAGAGSGAASAASEGGGASGAGGATTGDDATASADTGSAGGEGADMDPGSAGSAGSDGGAGSGEGIAETGDSRGAGALPEGGIAAASSASAGNKGDRLWSGAKNYWSGVKQSYHETMASNKAGIKEGAARLGNAAVSTGVGLAVAAKDKVAAHMSDKSKATVAKGANAVVSAGKAVANTVSDYTPTPVKAKIAAAPAKAVPAVGNTMRHLGRASKSLAQQGFVHLPGVRHYIRGRVNASQDRRLIAGDQFTQRGGSQISISGSEKSPALAQTQQVLRHFDNQMNDLKKMISGNTYIN